MQEKETAGIETYKKGQWMKFKSNSTLYYGVFSRIHNGELILSKITELAATEKGDELCVVDKEVGIPLSQINLYRKSSRKEAEAAIGNYSPYQRLFGQFVSLPSGSTTYCGRIARLNYDSIDLLPCLNFRQGKPYIEEETPVTVKTGNIQAISPSTREDLEYRVTELKKQFEQAEQQKSKEATKPQVPAPQEKKQD